MVGAWAGGVLGRTSARGELFIVRTREPIHLPLRRQGPKGDLRKGLLRARLGPWSERG